MKTILPAHTSSLSRLNRMLSGKAFDNARFFILVDENTYNHCLPHLISKVDRLQQAEFMEVPVSEECKDIAIATQLWQTLLESNADRNSVLVNLGGGCISDLGGFVAAGYKRGIRHINIPTTLVGMVDAAIGGKTALNLDNSKNQIGFFHQPAIVCVEPAFLDTLPDAMLLDGVFEMLKTFMVGDPGRYESLCGMILDGTFEVLPDMIAACAEIKTAVVRRDLYDRSVRRILNLGHTFGHAFETWCMRNGHPVLHGYAIAWGLVCELIMSHQQVAFPSQTLYDIANFVKENYGPLRITCDDYPALYELMTHDKKNEGEEINFTLMRNVGDPALNYTANKEQIGATLDIYRDLMGI